MGSGQVWCHPASFLVPFLSSFVYADEQNSDTDYKKQKADEQYYQLVSIHKSNDVRKAERSPVSSGPKIFQACTAFYVKTLSSRRLLQWYC